MNQAELNQFGAFVAGIIVTMMFVVLFSVTSNSDRIYAQAIDQAHEVCENNGGLLMINGAPSGLHTFVCLNGARFTYSKD